MVADELRDACYVYINVDDGWQDKREDSGSVPPKSTFDAERDDYPGITFKVIEWTPW